MLRASCHREGAESRGHSQRKGRRGACWGWEEIKAKGRGKRGEVTRLRSRVWAFTVCEFAGALKLVKASCRTPYFPYKFLGVIFLGVLTPVSKRTALERS